MTACTVLEIFVSHFQFHVKIGRFQIWRPVTAIFFYKPSFHWLINLYFLYSYSMRLETGIFAGRPADYAFMLFFR